MLDYTLDHLFSYAAGLVAPEIIGPAAEGVRVVFYTSGGEITGPRLRGKVRAVGGDWMTVRTDGVGLLDVRTTFESHDGALILMTYTGSVDLGADGYERFLRGELPATARLRMSPRLVTAHPDYIWLNRLHCLGVGEFDRAANRASYDVYAVR